MVDERGTVEGIVTLEDLIEEVVGDIYDEYDEPEPDIEVTDDGEIMVDGGASIDEVNERFDMSISSEDYDTIGGLIFGGLGRVPVVGDQVVVQDSGELIVTEAQDRRVTRVKIAPFRRKRHRPGQENDDDEETVDEAGRAESA